MNSTALATLNLSEHQVNALLSILNTSSNAKPAGNLQATTVRKPTTVIANDLEEMGEVYKKFTPSELLQKKKKNTKSTPAQELFLYTVRETARQVGLWEKAPCLNKIPYATLATFMEKVLSAMPQLAGYEQRIRERLSLKLTNRRNQIKNVLNWKRTTKGIDVTKKADDVQIVRRHVTSKQKQ